MSYEKKTDPSDLIRFYYETDDIFNEVSEVTSFKAASVIREKDGQPDFDRIQITADEKNFMKKYLKEAMLEVFASMFKIIGGDSIIHDTEITLEDASSVTASYADIVDNTPSGAEVTRYRTINLDLIDQLINNALVDFIMFKWYALKGLSGDAELHMAEFRNGLARIVEKTLALRQPS
jgi:hypothetical protein